MGAQTVPPTDCVDVKFFDDLRGVAACLACTADCEGGENANPSYLTVFVRSEDGGQTWAWDPDYEPVMSAPPFGAMMKYSGMLAMAFPEPNAGYLAGQNNLILRYTAATPEAAGWGPASCDPGAGGGTGSGGAGGGAGANGPAAAGSNAGSDSGCGCRAAGPTTPRGLGALAALAATLLAAARRRRR